MKLTPDLAARRLLMSAHLYYDRNTFVLTDAQYDALSRRVAQELEDDELLGLPDIAPVRIAQLGSAETVRASGFAFKLTRATVGGAEAWLEDATGEVLADGYVFKPTGESFDGSEFAAIGG